MSCLDTTYAKALNGSITFGDGFTQYYNRITINAGQVLLDVSAFGGGGYQVFVPGIKHLSGTASGFLSTASGGNPFGTDAYSCGLITIVFDVGCSISFYGFIGDTTVTENYLGNVEVTTSWAYADASPPTVTWSHS